MRGISVGSSSTMARWSGNSFISLMVPDSELREVSLPAKMINSQEPSKNSWGNSSPLILD